MRLIPRSLSRALPTAQAQTLTCVAALALVLAGAPAQQFGVLAKRHLPTAADATWGLALGDVDRDGDQDIVCANRRRQNRLYVNDGSGVFTDGTATRMPAETDNTASVALGDVDGDGDLDMVCANPGYQSRLYLNDGAGHFTDVTGARMPAGSWLTPIVRLGDVDGDRDPDIVLGGGQDRLYLNDGTGHFTDATAGRLPIVTRWTSAIAMDDVDGDGDLDLALGNDGQNRLYVNDGRGDFTDVSASHLPTDGDPTKAMLLDDVDGDGDRDLVCGNHALLQGQHMVGQQNRLYLNDGAGRFTDVTASHMPVDADWNLALALGDVDGDLDLDLVCGNGADRLYLNDGAGRFTDATATRLPPQSGPTTALVLGDVGGDGHLDLVGNGFYQDRLYLNDGHGHFVDATTWRSQWLGEQPDLGSTVLVDVDGDGDLDAVQYGWYPGVEINDGLGNFVEATGAGMPVVATMIALGDVDSDGDVDLVVANGALTCGWLQNGLYLNDGTGTFADATAARLPLDRDLTTSVVLGDVDGDLDLDIVFGAIEGSGTDGCPSQPAQNRLYLNDGRGFFTDATAARLPVAVESARALALGDVDGDGDPDIVCGNTGLSSGWPPSNPAQQDRIYLNDGTGTFTDGTATRLPIERTVTWNVTLGDVDGDGDLDLLCDQFDTGGASIGRLFLNDGVGRFADVTNARLPGGVWTGGVLADADGDGDLDIVLGGLQLFVNDGTGTFTDATATRMPRMPVGFNGPVALGDLDGDGDSDLVCGGLIYRNLQRQLDAPLLLRVGRTSPLDVYARFGPPSTRDVALPFLSPGRASIPLPPLGTLILDPNALLPLPPVAIPQPAGMGSVAVAVPPTPGLAGARVYAQAALLQDPFRPKLTNGIADVVVR